ncbi:MAG: hypothetical protein MUQ26_04940, partial [Armatimonadetes bacterium]|nr:hypothetical protein [Armatimonadota bacterium]
MAPVFWPFGKKDDALSVITRKRLVCADRKGISQMAADQQPGWEQSAPPMQQEVRQLWEALEKAV